MTRGMRALTMPKPTHGSGRFRYADNHVKAKFELGKECRIELNGVVDFGSDLGETGVVLVRMGRNANLIIHSDFKIGPGVTIIVNDHATLIIGGKRDNASSGITSNCRIMVAKCVRIGYDTIIAWDTFITDCDWHSIMGSNHTAPCMIGDHVWIAHGSSVLKGACIANGSILAAHSVCLAGEFPHAALLAGAPARVVQNDVSWSSVLS